MNTTGTSLVIKYSNDATMEIFEIVHGHRDTRAKCTARTRARTPFRLINGTANLIRMVVRA